MLTKHIATRGHKMGNAIFFILINFAFFLVMELVMMGAFQLSKSTKAKKVIGIMCRAFLGLFIIVYLALVVLCVVVGVDLIFKGEIGQGISVFFFAVLIAVCVYIWLITGWVKHIKGMKTRDR